MRNWPTVVKHRVRCLVNYRGGRLDSEAGPLLHGGAIDVLLGMLLREVRYGQHKKIAVGLRIYE